MTATAMPSVRKVTMRNVGSRNSSWKFSVLVVLTRFPVNASVV